jgi:hypothetical protein
VTGVTRDGLVDDGEGYRKVMQAIEEYIFQNHKFPSKSQVAELAQIPETKCNLIIDKLVLQNQLYSVFGGGHGKPEVILPYDMMQSIIMTQRRPEWMQKYAFPEKTTIEKEIEKLNSEYLQYDMFERLLYRTDTPLEEAVAFTLKWLGFENVFHHLEKKDYADITFELDKTKGMVEVEGTTKQGDKRKVLQLEGWVKTELEKGEVDSSQIRGFFVVNHFREDDPSTRADPLTEQAKKFLGHYRFRFFTGAFLFDIVKRVQEVALSREEAQRKVWEGEKVR